MSPSPDAVHACTSADHCITCSDEGVPMRVIDAGADTEIAICADADGRRCEVMTGLVGAVAAGDMVLVHAGTALRRLDRTVESAA